LTSARGRLVQEILPDLCQLVFQVVPARDHLIFVRSFAYLKNQRSRGDRSGEWTG
jgi:hypothetical protein